MDPAYLFGIRRWRMLRHHHFESGEMQQSKRCHLLTPLFAFCSVPSSSVIVTCAEMNVPAATGLYISFDAPRYASGGLSGDVSITRSENLARFSSAPDPSDLSHE